MTGQTATVQSYLVVRQLEGHLDKRIRAKKRYRNLTENRKEFKT